LSLASRTKAKASGNNSSSAVPLCARDFNSSVKAPVRAGNGCHGTAWATPGSWEFWPNRRIHGFCLVFFSNKMQIIQLMYLQASADPTNPGCSFSFRFFSFFWCLRQGFLKQETPSAKQPTQKKHTYPEDPQRSSSSDFAFICSSKALMASLGPYGDG